MCDSDENKKKVQAWKDFQHKITYIYEKMFNKNDWLLTEAFSSDVLTRNDYNNRVKSIRHWLNGDTKRPNKFDLSRYKIGEYKMPNGSLLFCEDSFKLWCFEHFKHKVDEYMLIENPDNMDLSILYVYFFSYSDKEILYHTIHYDKTIKDGECKLFSRNNASWEFSGKQMSTYNSLNFEFENKAGKKVSYVFDARDEFIKDLRVFGFQITIDYTTKLPISSLVMLSGSKLTTYEKIKCRHKLNESSINIARAFPRKIKSEEEFLYQNFNYKMDKLKFDLSLLSKKNLKQYLIEHLFDSFNSIEKNKSTFDITIGDYFNFLSFCWLPKEKKTDIKWVFNFNYWMFWILSEKVSNPIINKHKQLVKDGFNIEYIFVLNSRDEQLKPLTIEKLKEFEECGIKIYITYPYISENQFLFVDNFSMVMSTSNSMETTISLDDEYRNSFKKRYEKIKAKAIDLDSFVKNVSHLELSGTWYIYSPRSVKPLPEYAKTELEVRYPKFTITFHHGKSYVGEIKMMDKQILFLLDDTILKVAQDKMKNKIFPISIVSNVESITHKSLLTFAIMTREQLPSDIVVGLLEILTQEPRILNINDDIYLKTLKY